MPVAKIAFKSTVLDLELDNVEITVGPEIMKVGHLKASVDVADLLRVQLPELMKGDAMGVMFKEHGLKKIQCIKEVRAMTNWGLREAKIFVESAPILLKASEMEFMPDGDLVAKAEEAARIFKGCGATVEVCYGTERIPTVLDRFREMLVEALGRRTNVSPSIAEE
jgi:ribosomal protein L7/L12